MNEWPSDFNLSALARVLLHIVNVKRQRAQLREEIALARAGPRED